MAASTHQLHEEKNYSAQVLFDLIYSGAIQKNKDKINLALQYAHINLIIAKSKTPAYQLALKDTEEADEALEFLLETYPEERNILLSEMILGRAESGQIKKAYALLARATNPIEQFRFLKAIIFGLATANNTPEIAKLLAKAPLQQQTSLIIYKLCGYAKRGDEKQVNELLDTDLKNEDRIILLANIINYYGRYGHIAKAERIIADAIQTNMRDEDLLSLQKSLLASLILDNHPDASTQLEENKLELSQTAAHYYALIGDDHHVKQLLDSVSEDRKFSLLLEAISGYAEGGHLNQFKSLLKELIIPTQDPITVNLQNGIINFTAFCLGKSGSNAGINYLCMLTNNRVHQTELLKQFVCARIPSGDIDSANRALANIGDPVNALVFNIGIATTLALQIPYVDLTTRSMLFMLSAFNVWFQDKLAAYLTGFLAATEMKMDINRLVPRAAQLIYLERKTRDLYQPIHYRFHCHHWIETQEFLLRTGAGLVKNGHLSKDTFLRISTFLSGMSSTQTFDLSNRLSVCYRSGFFHRNATKAFYEKLIADDQLLVLEENENNPSPSKKPRR